MKRLLLVIFAIMPLLAFATDEVCPAGYQPDEYIELEYIESTGTQYIDTEIRPLSNYSFKADYMFTGTNPPTGHQTFFGLYTGKIKDYGVLFGPIIYAYNGKSVTAQSSIVLNTKFSLYYDGINKRLTTTNGDDVDFSAAPGFSGETPVSIKLFDLTYTTGSFKYPFKGRLYYLVIYVENDTVANLIPVRRLSDGEIGMYDTVENKFYGNNGTGEFIAGPELQSFIAVENGDIVCVSCPANTYKPNAGNEQCTKCPEHTFSPVGSTSLSDCAKILRIKDYVVYMPLGKRTEHGLCVMMDGKKYCADVYERQ